MRRGHRRDLEQSAELNLTAFIDVFVTLIVFLLLSAVFVHLGSLAVKTPQALVEGQAPSEHLAAKRELSLLVRVDGESIHTAVYDSGKGSETADYRKTFPIKDLKSIQTFLSALKVKEGSFQRALFQVSPQTIYQRAISVLDVLQRSELSSDVVLAVGVQGDPK